MFTKLNKLKQLFWTSYQPITLDVKSSEIVKEALAHYCAMCKMGFKTRNGKKGHVAWKHNGQRLKKN